jgi:transposase-like protein
MCHLTPEDGAEGRKSRTGAVSQRRVWKCSACRKQFSVTTGSIFHGSKIPLRTWLLVLLEMVSSKNGVASRELERKCGLTPKSARFMSQRFREAMKRRPTRGPAVQDAGADEMWIGGDPGNQHAHKRVAMARTAWPRKRPPPCL